MRGATPGSLCCHWFGGCSAKEKLFALIQKIGLWPRSAWLPLAGIALICFVLAFGAEDAREWGRYERVALETGELWRLVTGHLVHLSWSHLWLNLAALGLLAIIFGEVLSAMSCLFVLLLSILGIDVGLYLLQPEISWYVGLSGVLHGVIAAGSLLLLWRDQTRFGLVIAATLIGKLSYEQWFGPLPFTQSASGGPVVVSAHLYGAIGGAVAVIPGILHRHLAPSS